MSSILQAIGPTKLTEYFEFLDNLRESGVTNMWGAPAYLMKAYKGMTKEEAFKVHSAWIRSFSESLPAEDRVDNVFMNLFLLNTMVENVFRGDK